MKDDRSILIGCNNTSKLSLILYCLKGTPNSNYISSILISDLVNILKSIKPSLVTLDADQTSGFVTENIKTSNTIMS